MVLGVFSLPSNFPPVIFHINSHTQTDPVQTFVRPMASSSSGLLLPLSHCCKAVLLCMASSPRSTLHIFPLVCTWSDKYCWSNVQECSNLLNYELNLAEVFGLQKSWLKLNNTFNCNVHVLKHLKRILRFKCQLLYLFSNHFP